MEAVKTAAPDGKPKRPKADKAAQRAARRWRLGVLVGLLVGMWVLGYLHQYGKVWKPAGLDAFCPFGGLETLWSFVAGYGIIRRVELSSIVLLVAVLGVALVFGRSFCGRICPLGTLQELAGRLGRRLFGRQLAVPAALDRPARYLKYAVLAVITFWTWQAADLVIRPYDPWAAWQHLSSAEVFAEFGIGLAVLGAAMAGSVVYDRFFCKYACPMGAVLGVVSKLSMFKVGRDKDLCIDCRLCDKACPVGIKVSEAERVTSAECLSCGECVTACPVQDVLVTEVKGGRRLSLKQSMWLPLAAFAAVVAIATAAGMFDWTAPSLATYIERSGDSAETFDVSLIKGRMTLQEVADASGVPVERFQERFGIADADVGRPMKEYVHGMDLEMDDIRVFVEEARAQQ